MVKVITYGTYDLLHSGHLRLLERAKALGDCLIVGVTADDFDRRRGKLNVQQSLMERLENVKATGLADKVVVEEYECQKIDDIKRYGADIFTVGSDWEGQFDYLNKYCRVIYLPRTKGISSTDIRMENSRLRLGIKGHARLARKYAKEAAFVNMYEHPVEVIKANVNGTGKLLEFLRKTGHGRFLYLSSGEVYGETENVEALGEHDFGRIDQDSVRSCYPLAKRLAENLCLSYFHEYGVDTVVARPAHTYGPTHTDKDSRATAQFTKQAARGENIVLRSRGGQFRSYTYVADGVAGLLTILFQGKAGEAYNVADTAAQVSIAEFAKIAAKVSGVSMRYGDNARQPTPVSRAVLDNRKLCAIGWQPRFTAVDGILHTVSIERKIQQELYRVE